MSYDHNDKAGNQGDIIKHPALFAALWSIMSKWQEKRSFVYADIFAAYAHNTLVPNGEWKNGLAKLSPQMPNNTNTYLKTWHDWYFASRSRLESGMYPGSSLLAADITHHFDKPIKMQLFDIAPQPIANLMTVHTSREHEIYTRPATPKDVASADFIFIDPPSIDEWKFVLDFLNAYGTSKTILVWVPLNWESRNQVQNETSPSKQPQEWVSKNSHFTIFRTQWRSGVQTVGCQLLCNSSISTPVCDTAKSVVKLMGW